MSTIDKVRLALVEEIQKSNLPIGIYLDTEPLARAAIKAMIEPSQGILDCRPPFMTIQDARTMWQTMIDAALKS